MQVYSKHVTMTHTNQTLIAITIPIWKLIAPYIARHAPTTDYLLYQLNYGEKYIRTYIHK